MKNQKKRSRLDRWWGGVNRYSAKPNLHETAVASKDKRGGSISKKNTQNPQKGSRMFHETTEESLSEEKTFRRRGGATGPYTRE